MNNTWKIIAAIAAAATFAAATYFGFYYKFEDNLTGWEKLRKKKPEEKKDDTTATGGGVGESTGNIGAGAITNVMPQGKFPISKGDKNELVARLQKSLKSKTWNQPIEKVDGNFESKTATALKAIGYGESVKDNDTLVKIEMGVKPIAITPASGFGVLAVNKTVYATVTGKSPAYDLSKGTESSLTTTRGMLIGTITRLVGDTVYVDIDGKRWSLHKKFVDVLS